jgi:hypothetical protein
VTGGFVWLLALAAVEVFTENLGRVRRRIKYCYDDCQSELKDLSGHDLHCPDCDKHLTSLFLCPECGQRYEEDWI